MPQNDMPGALGSNAMLGPSPERAEFEDWYRRRSDHYEFVRGFHRDLRFGAPGIPEADSRYHEDCTQMAWEGWQAATAKALERESRHRAAAPWLI